MPRLKKDKEFESFWAAYPRKVKKTEARKAWETLKKSGELPPLSDLLMAIDKHKTQEHWDKKYMIPYPANWLKGLRWEDEVEEPGVEYVPKRVNGLLFRKWVKQCES